MLLEGTRNDPDYCAKCSCTGEVGRVVRVPVERLMLVSEWRNCPCGGAEVREVLPPGWTAHVGPDSKGNYSRHYDYVTKDLTNHYVTIIKEQFETPEITVTGLANTPKGPAEATNRREWKTPASTRMSNAHTVKALVEKAEFLCAVRSCKNKRFPS